MAALLLRGVDLELVVPARWRNEYQSDLRPGVAPGLEGRVHPLRTLGRGRPQRHVYLSRCAEVLRRYAPDVLVLEEEPFSLAARQWGSAARRVGVPFGVQLAENLDRPLPRAALALRSWSLANADFVVARSPSAADLARRWGARGAVGVVPHSVAPVDPRPRPVGPPTVCFVGRLVPEKGLADLLAAVSRLEGVRLLVVGDGPLRAMAQGAGPNVEVLGGLGRAGVDRAYEQAHVTCVPSRTTTTWSEQFGRVAVESLVRGVPVVATRSGELPWVLATTGGGVLVDEGDVAALRAAVEGVLADPVRAEHLGAEGRAGVLEHFSDDAAAAALHALLDRVR